MLCYVYVVLVRTPLFTGGFTLMDGVLQFGCLQAHLQKIVQAFCDYRQHALQHVAYVESGYRMARAHVNAAACSLSANGGNDSFLLLLAELLQLTPAQARRIPVASRAETKLPCVCACRYFARLFHPRHHIDFRLVMVASPRLAAFF